VHPRVVRSLLATGGLAFFSSVACTTEASLAAEPDQARSAEVEARFARCLQLPAETVQVYVDADGYLLSVEWHAPDGVEPVRSTDVCIDRLGLSWWGDRDGNVPAELDDQ
jgi:hypothetical protein